MLRLRVNPAEVLILEAKPNYAKFSVADMQIWKDVVVPVVVTVEVHDNIVTTNLSSGITAVSGLQRNSIDIIDSLINALSHRGARSIFGNSLFSTSCGCGTTISQNNGIIHTSNAGTFRITESPATGVIDIDELQDFSAPNAMQYPLWCRATDVQKAEILIQLARRAILNKD